MSGTIPAISWLAFIFAGFVSGIGLGMWIERQ